MITPQILKLDAHGQPEDWINWEEAVVYHAKGLVSWSLGEVAFAARGGNNRVTGQQSVIKTSSIIAVKGESKGKRRHKIPSLSNEDLYNRDRYVCAYCGHKFPKSKLSKDHILPKAHGGKDTWTNLVTCCTKCNQRKDNKTPEQAGMQLLYVPYVPSKAEHLILSNRNILQDQMDFLLAFVSDDSRLKKEILASMH